MRQRMPRVEVESHLRFVRGLPCVICLNPVQTEAAHLRRSDVRVGRVNSGSHKPHDMWVIPLCGFHHRTGAQAQHVIGEDKFSRLFGFNDNQLAAVLWMFSGNQELCEKIVINQIQRPE